MAKGGPRGYGRGDGAAGVMRGNGGEPEGGMTKMAVCAGWKKRVDPLMDRDVRVIAGPFDDLQVTILRHSRRYGG